MGIYDFDELIDRKNTNSLKHDFPERYGIPEDALPLWVADMDFRAPNEVLEALHLAVEHGIFGYSQVKQDYNDVVIHWFEKRFGWQAKPQWLVKSPGVVFAITAAIRAYTEIGDGVLIQQPVYYPFANTITNNKRTLINNELMYHNGRYEIDFVDFEQKIRYNHVKLFIFCSPHNPVGRVWTKEELQKIAAICLQYNVIVVSDEIHCDFTFLNHLHTIFASMSEEIADRCIVCTSPSKTFNLAGLQISNIFVKNQKLRRRLRESIRATGFDEINTFGLVASKAAYQYGDVWLDELKSYLEENLEFVKLFLQYKIPQITLVETEGTYLVWLDCRELNLSDQELEDLMVHKAKLWLDSGSIFGNESGQFQRINIACPRSVLEEALIRLEKTVE